MSEVFSPHVIAVVTHENSSYTSHAADLLFTLCLCCIKFSHFSCYLSSNCIWVQIYKNETTKPDGPTLTLVALYSGQSADAS